MSRNKNALIIVEGGAAEPRFIGKPGKRLGLLPFMAVADYQFYVFGSTIYELYEKYMAGEYDDIVTYLAVERGLPLPPGETPRTAFSAIYLVFDFEPQHYGYSDEKIRQMCDLFDNETELGKLYINYPMLEACKHLKSLPDPEFMSRTVDISGDFNGSKYKRAVNTESCIGHYTVKNMAHMIAANYNKAKLLDGDTAQEIGYSAILEKQIALKNQENKVYELGTVPLMAVDYNVGLALEKFSLKYDSDESWQKLSVV